MTQILGLIGMILPFIMKMANYWFDKKNIEKERRLAFYEFINGYEKHMKPTTVKSESYQKQKQRLKELLK